VRNVSALRVALALVVAFVGLSVVACGSEEEKTSGAEGEYINAGEAVYQVQITRLLNRYQLPDSDLLQGQPPAASGEQYMGVFLTIENEGDMPYRPPRDMKVVDTQGNQYLPLGAGLAAGFGLDFGEVIEPGQQAPPPNSPAAESPIAGDMVLFRLSEESATDNLPLVLEIPAGKNETSKITLDI
jgi:hypothetical protein